MSYDVGEVKERLENELRILHFKAVDSLISEILIFKLILICQFQNVPYALDFEVIIITVFCPRAGPSLQAQEPRLQFCRRQVIHRKLGN